MSGKDILYYSNYCKHSKQVIGHLAKNNITKELNCICVDKRKIDQTNGNTYVVLENGNSVLLPPNIHSVPSLLIVKNNYSVIMGNSILSHYKVQMAEANDMAVQGNGEPTSFSLGTKDVMSEAFTMYDASAEDLSAKGQGGNRSLGHYVSASGEAPKIQTPPDDYKSEKLSGDMTVENLSQKRNDDIQQAQGQPSFVPSI